MEEVKEDKDEELRDQRPCGVKLPEEERPDTQRNIQTYLWYLAEKPANPENLNKNSKNPRKGIFV